MPPWPVRSTALPPWPPTPCWPTASTRPSSWAGRSASAAWWPGSATSSTRTATLGPTSSSRPCGGGAGTVRLRRRVEALAALVADRTGGLPNIDLASAAVLHALDLPAESGEVVFQVARSVGVAAHVVEEYAEEPLRWRGRDPQG